MGMTQIIASFAQESKKIIFLDSLVVVQWCLMRVTSGAPKKFLLNSRHCIQIIANFAEEAEK